MPEERDDKPLSIIRAPTAGDIARLLRTGSGTVRLLRDIHSGDIYAWDAESAFHEQAIRHLGLGDRAENLGQASSLAEFRRKAGAR